MFGIFYMLFSGFMGTAGKVQRDVRDDNARYEARKNGQLTYHSHNGERLVSNNRNVYVGTSYGDRVLKDLKTGYIYKNYDAEKRHEVIQKARDKGKTVISVDYDEYNRYCKYDRDKVKRMAVSPEYKDIETGRYYIDAYINGIAFYMDIITGELIRPRDGEKFSYKMGKASVEDIIRIVNKRQKELYEIPAEEYDYIWWEDHFYLHGRSYELYIDNNNNIVEGNRRDPQMREFIIKLKESTNE